MPQKDPHFTADDVVLMNRIMDLHPELREIATVVKRVASANKFPINSFDDLVEALGGESATVSFRGRTMTVGEIRRLVPAYYFPISSDRDLIAKVMDLQSHAPVAALAGPPVTEGVDVKWSTQVAALPHGAPAHPALTSQQVHELVRDEQAAAGVRSSR